MLNALDGRVYHYRRRSGHHPRPFVIQLRPLQMRRFGIRVQSEVQGVALATRRDQRHRRCSARACALNNTNPVVFDRGRSWHVSSNTGRRKKRQQKEGGGWAREKEP